MEGLGYLVLLWGHRPVHSRGELSPHWTARICIRWQVSHWYTSWEIVHEFLNWSWQLAGVDISVSVIFPMTGDKWVVSVDMVYVRLMVIKHVQHWSVRPTGSPRLREWEFQQWRIKQTSLIICFRAEARLEFSWEVAWGKDCYVYL